MKKLILVIIMLFVGFGSQAQEKKNKNAKYTFEVSGNCEHCQMRIQKTAYKVKGVKMANWDIGTHQMEVIINEKMCSVEDVKKAIAAVGHNVEGYVAQEEVYNKLPECCKYER